jgi:DNA end-binding protein Ku
MRPLWTGALSFGLVNIPVRVTSAVRITERISFRLLHKTDLAPIRYQRVCEEDDKPVDWADIVKGYEYAKGKYVVLTDDDFKAAAIESSKRIDILDFVRVDEIDPRYFETPYYLLPDKGGEKPYALLREAIRRTETVGIGTITMRANSHHLAGVKVVGDALVLEIMRFAGELVDVAELTVPAGDDLRPQELEMAEQLVNNLTEPFDPSKYTDDYHDNLRKIIKAKMKGKPLEIAESEEHEATRVVDLMERLRESLEMGKRRGHTAGEHAAAKPTGKATKRRERRPTRRRRTA